MNKIVLLTAFISFNLFAVEAQFGRIVDLKGEGFISYKGKTREIKKGDSIEMGAEIVIEHHGQVSFTDNADHRYHLGNASSASVSGSTVELRGGDLWFQSLNKNDNYKIQSANAIVDYSGGEAILSYDSVKGKTQLMVINGMMKLSNLRSSELNLMVTEGHFSFIDNAYDEGAPRDPTPVGEKTYGQLVALFNGIAPMDKNSEKLFKNVKEHGEKEHAVAAATRAIASEKAEETPASLVEDYKNNLLAKKVTEVNEVKEVKVKPIAKKSKVAHLFKPKLTDKLVIHIYGQTRGVQPASLASETPKTTHSRAPASVLETEVPSDTVVPGTVSPYSKDYKNQYKESDKLIDDLKKL
jgi:hypothetical protein